MLAKKIYEQLDLLSRHIRVLEVVREKQPIGIARISHILNIGDYEVRHSLAILEKNGLIEPTSNGAVIKGNINDALLTLAEELNEIEDITKLIRKEVLKLVI